jgi:hypothetical protein
MVGKLFAQLDSEGRIPLGYHLISKIYVFGDARGAPELCNAAVDLCFQKCMQDWTYPFVVLSYVYDNTVEDSRLRRFLVTYGVENFGFKTLRVYKHYYPQDFLVDLVDELRVRDQKLGHMSTISNGKYIRTKTPEICSKYHDHAASTMSASS